MLVASKWRGQRLAPIDVQDHDRATRDPLTEIYLPLDFGSQHVALIARNEQQQTVAKPEKKKDQKAQPQGRVIPAASRASIY
jgi:hypothetical protein